MRKEMFYEPKAGKTKLIIPLKPEQVAQAMEIAQRYGIGMKLEGDIINGFWAEFWPEKISCGADWSFFLADLYRQGIELPPKATMDAIETIDDEGV